MTLSKILERAKRGDPAAIAALFNRSLQSRGITVTASCKDDCLYIHLVSAQFPETKRLIGFILQGIRRLDAKSIHIIQIDGQLIGHSDYLFQQKLAVSDTASEKWQKSSSQLKTPRSLQFSNQGDPVRHSDSFSIAATEQPTEHLGKASVSERTDADIVANIEGRISGQVATGNYILQIGSMHGGVVRVVSEEKQPTPKPRSLPVFLRPRPFRNLVGRKREVATAIKTLQSVQPLEFYGQSGLGKTSLLRHLAYHPQAISDFADGVVYLAAERQAVPDLLQALFDAFYETDRPLKPTETQLRHALQQLRALVLLDDVTLSRDKLQLLMNEAPGCIFAMTASNRHLWGEGKSLLLPNLSLEDALLLVERELGRKVLPEEHSVATELCTFLKGHPLQILKAVALAKERELSLAGVLRKLRAVSSPEVLTTQVAISLSEPERQVLKILQVLGNVPIRAEALAGLMNLPTLEPTLSTFLKKGLIQTDGNHYRLSDHLVRPLQDNEDLNSDLDGLLNSMRSWVEQPCQTPQTRLQDSRLLQRGVEVAFQTGRWTDVLFLGKHLQGILALTGYWDSWNQLLQWHLRAAQRLGDSANEAWALHQLGTRALCLKEFPLAYTSLRKALEIRQAMDNQAGMRISSHNLSLIPTVTSASENISQPPPLLGLGGGASLLIKGAATLLTITTLGTGGLWLQSTLHYESSSPELEANEQFTPNTNSVKLETDEQLILKTSPAQSVPEKITEDSAQGEIPEFSSPENIREHRLLESIPEQSELSEHEGECLLGAWEAEPNSFHSSITNSLQSLDNSSIQYVGTTGYLLVTFHKDDQYTAVYEDLTHNFQSKVLLGSEEKSISIKVRFEGRITASITKSEDDRTLSYSNGNYTELNLKIEAPELVNSILQDGESIDSNLSSSDLLNSTTANLNLPGGEQLTGFLEELEQLNQVSYTCDYDNLEITNRFNLDSSKEFIDVRRFSRISH